MQSVDANYVDEVAREGFAIIEDALDADTVESLIQDLSAARRVRINQLAARTRVVRVRHTFRNFESDQAS